MEDIHGKEKFWMKPSFSNIRSSIRWSLRWYKERTITLHTKDLILSISGNPLPEKHSMEGVPFMVGAECSHGWRNLVNTEFSGMVNMVIGGQRADYPGSGCSTYETTLRIAQVLYETGKLDEKVKWDNPPPSTLPPDSASGEKIG